MVSEVALLNFKSSPPMLIELNLADHVKVPSRISQEKHEIANLSIMNVESSRINRDFQLFEIELVYGLVADVPRIHEELAALVLS